MNIIKKLSLFTLVFSMLFLVSCEDDSSDPATSGTLNISINLTNPDSWPAEGTVFCSLDKLGLLQVHHINLLYCKVLRCRMVKFL